MRIIRREKIQMKFTQEEIDVLELLRRRGKHRRNIHVILTALCEYVERNGLDASIFKTNRKDYSWKETKEDNYKQ